jgi:hypothetical protein
MKNIYVLLTFALAVFISGCASNQSSPVNLIQNGSAELPKYDSIPPGWQNVKGHWVSLEGDSAKHYFGYAQDSGYYFFAGNCAIGILQQDVNVSKYASQIDKSRQQFILISHEQSLDQGPNSDQGMVSIQALDNSKAKTLYSYSSDTARSISKWVPLADTFLAPASTRFIRVQLIAVRHVGGDNDGYFDNISLITRTTGFDFDKKWLLITIAIVLIVVAASVFIYKSSRNKKMKSTGNK